MTDNMLNFVKDKLEENEGVAPDALARLLAAAKSEKAATIRFSPHAKQWTLLAASLAVAACGWLIRGNTIARRESNLTNVIVLLQAADEGQKTENDSLVDALLSWQDAPSVVAND